MSKRSVLLVDDSRLSREIVKNIVRSHFPDWQVLEANEANEGKAILSAQAIDLVIVDYNMPGPDGLTFIEGLSKQHPKTRFCLLTANVQRPIRDQAQSLGATFIPKPITENNVLDALKLVA